MMTSELNIKLQAAIEATAQKLTVAYSVANQCGTDIGIFNGLATLCLDDTLSFSRNHVYVEFQDGILNLRKSVLPIPEDLQVGERTLPYITLISNGDVFSEQFEVRLPARVCQPLIRASLAEPDMDIVAADARQFHTVRLLIGVFQVTPEIRMLPISSAYPKFFRAWPPPADRQVLLTAERRFESPLPVLAYKPVPINPASSDDDS